MHGIHIRQCFKYVSQSNRNPTKYIVEGMSENGSKSEPILIVSEIMARDNRKWSFFRPHESVVEAITLIKVYIF